MRDAGCHSGEPVDYPDYVSEAVRMVIEKDVDLGVLICNSGQGVSIVANRYPGIRAALCWNTSVATSSRTHNNANVLCIPAGFVTPQQVEEMTRIFLETAFEGGRHQRRVEKIEQHPAGGGPPAPS